MHTYIEMIDKFTNGLTVDLANHFMKDYTEDFHDELVALIEKGQKLKAVKNVKERCYLGLKECKEIIDFLTKEERVAIHIIPDKDPFEFLSGREEKNKF